MGFFLHIPFPAPEVFTALPQHQRLARGLCAFDLVGFQTERDTANFRRYLVESAEAIAARRRPRPGLRPDRRAPRPSRSASTPTTSPPQADGRGGPRRRRAPRAGSSRTARSSSASTAWTIPRACRSAWRPSAACSTTTRSCAAGSASCRSRPPRARPSTPTRCCARSSTASPAGSTPTMPTSTGCRSATSPAATRRGTLCGLYRLARVGLVTPLHDGMNLVAKEFVAAQTPERPRRPRPLRVRRRRRAAAGGAPRQPARHRRHRRRHLPRALDAARGAHASAGSELIARACASTTSPGGAAPSSRALERDGRASRHDDLDGLAPRGGRRALPRLRRHPRRDRPRPRRDRARRRDTAAALARLAARLGGAVAHPQRRATCATSPRRTPADRLARRRPRPRDPRPRRRPCPRRRRRLPEAVLAPLRAAARPPGVRLELKGPVAALHYRAAPGRRGRLPRRRRSRGRRRPGPRASAGQDGRRGEARRRPQGRAPSAASPARRPSPAAAR